MPNTIAPFGHPLYVMLKPVGAVCNLRCEYCYYLEKQNLYDKAERHVMTEEMLERFTREYIEAQTMPQVLFTWHGGEPLMRPLSFYKKALELQRKYARGRQISNVIQTNGTLALWNIMATCIPATTLSSRNTSWATSAQSR